MNTKTVLSPSYRESFENELITYFYLYFKFNYVGDKAKLIEIYKDSRHVDKTGLWDRVGHAVNITGQKAYKYYTNTWSRMYYPKWPKETKNQFKLALAERVKNEFDRTYDVYYYRTALLKSFVEDEQIKDRFPQYHFDSLYFYLYNVISSTMTKLGADMHDLSSLYADYDNYKKPKARRSKKQEYSMMNSTSESRASSQVQTMEYEVPSKPQPEIGNHFQVAAVPYINLGVWQPNDYGQGMYADQYSNQMRIGRVDSNTKVLDTDQVFDDHIGHALDYNDLIQNVKELMCNEYPIDKDVHAQFASPCYNGVMPQGVYHSMQGAGAHVQLPSILKNPPPVVYPKLFGEFQDQYTFASASASLFPSLYY